MAVFCSSFQNEVVGEGGLFGRPAVEYPPSRPVEQGVFGDKSRQAVDGKQIYDKEKRVQGERMLATWLGSALLRRDPLRLFGTELLRRLLPCRPRRQPFGVAFLLRRRRVLILVTAARHQQPRRIGEGVDGRLE